MADLFTVQLKGLDELMKIASANLGSVMREILHEVGGLVKKEISREPGPVHKPIQWASEKQRRYVMAMVRKYGPWTRETHPLSQKLRGSWEVTDESDYRVRVHNPVSYGPWVQSADLQQPMHANTGWRTDEGVIQYVSMSREVERIAGEKVEHVLEGK